ncbi:MAG: GNAT family N-acetyltransferase [Alphaproteobacteria bacterium]
MLRLLRTLSYNTPLLRLDARRVFLRAPSERDWREWAELRAVSRAFLEPWEPSWPADALARAIYRRRLDQIADELRSDTGHSFHIFRRGDERLVGGISLTNIRRGVVQSGTLGYWIGQPFERLGLMTEALASVVEFGYERLKLHRLEAACLPANEASRRVLQKCGFQQEGYARGYLRINGEWHDHVLFGLLHDDWKRERATR